MEHLIGRRIIIHEREHVINAIKEVFYSVNISLGKVNFNGLEVSFECGGKKCFEDIEELGKLVK